MKLFEVRAPDGRALRQPHESLEAARAAVIAGYAVTGEVLGASADGAGGFVDPVGLGTQSFMATLLASRGDELLAWLKERGIPPDVVTMKCEIDTTAFDQRLAEITKAISHIPVGGGPGGPDHSDESGEPSK
jgi:hypothetical protein